MHVNKELKVIPASITRMNSARGIALESKRASLSLSPKELSLNRKENIKIKPTKFL